MRELFKPIETALDRGGSFILPSIGNQDLRHAVDLLLDHDQAHRHGGQFRLSPVIGPKRCKAEAEEGQKVAEVDSRIKAGALERFGQNAPPTEATSSIAQTTPISISPSQ